MENKKKNILGIDELLEKRATSKQEEKTEKIQVLLSNEDLTDLAKKIAKKALSKGEKPESISAYVGSLVRKDLGRTSSE